MYKQLNGSTSPSEKKRQIKEMGGKLPPNYAIQVEGVETLVPYAGTLDEIVSKLAANIRSGFSYLGARNMGELWENAEFVRVSPMGFKENGADNAIQ
jgi:IMP dehydrogenase